MREAPVAREPRRALRAARRRAQDRGLRAAVQLRAAAMSRSTRTSRASARALACCARGAPFEELHDTMLALTPPGEELEFHLNLLRHGRRTCFARCAGLRACALARMCPRVGL